MSIKGRRPGRGLAIGVGLVFAALVLAAGSAQAGSAYTVGKFAIEAQAKDAVAAKSRAIAEGQRLAFRALLKRLTPFRSYAQLPDLDSGQVDRLLTGLSFRSECNSTTRYLAVLDFRFEPRSVQALLKTYGVPYLDRQAPRVTVVPISLDANGAASNSAAWRRAWSGLDGENALAPFKVARWSNQLTAADMKRVLNGQALDRSYLQDKFGGERVVLILARADPKAKTVWLRFSGHDAVGPLNWSHSLKAPGGTNAALKHAVRIGAGVLEGRWKHEQLGDESGDAGNRVEPLKVFVMFSNRGQWLQIRRRLKALPGVSGLSVQSLSSRGALVRLDVAGGATGLIGHLASEGLVMEKDRRGWVMRSL